MNKILQQWKNCFFFTETNSHIIPSKYFKFHLCIVMQWHATNITYFLIHAKYCTKISIFVSWALCNFVQKLWIHIHAQNHAKIITYILYSCANKHIYFEWMPNFVLIWKWYENDAKSRAIKVISCKNAKLLRKRISTVSWEP